MDYKAIGLIETNSVAKGMECADDMLKTADVELLMGRSVCPGRYLAMIAGDVSSVENSVDVGGDTAAEFLVGKFIIPNVHPSVIPALSCTTAMPPVNALGIIETFSTVSCIQAADAAAKAADVELIEIRCATGLAGKAYVTLTGDVGSVNAAVDAGVAAVQDEGMIQNFVVLPSPSQELFSMLA